MIVYVKINDYVISFEFDTTFNNSFQLDIVETAVSPYDKEVIKTVQSSDYQIEDNYMVIDVSSINFSKNYSGISVTVSGITETYFYGVNSHEYYTQIRENHWGDEKDPYYSDNFKFLTLEEFHKITDKTTEPIETPLPQETPKINVEFATHIESIDNNIQSLNISVLSLNIIVLFVLILSILRKLLRI